MKNIKANVIAKFIIALFIIGILTGIIFYLTYKPNLTSYFNEFKSLIETTHQNTYLSSLFIVGSIFVLSVSIVGVPVLLFYIFYEGLSLGFTASLFLSFSFKKFIFYLIFVVLAKAIFIIFILYFTIISVKSSIKLFNALIEKNRVDLERTIINHFYRFMIVLALVLLNSTLIFLFANKILALIIKWV